MRLGDVMIPHHIFFTFTSLPGGDDKPFSYIHYLAVKSAALVNRCPIRCYYEVAPTGPHWDRALRYLTPVQIPVLHEIAGIPLAHPAHRSDVLRLQLLIEKGGIYLDLDVICVRPFSDLLGNRIVMGRESSENVCNGVILSEAGSPIITAWLQGYHPDTSLTRGFLPLKWRAMSIDYATLLSTNHPDIITVLEPHAFHFPAWDSKAEFRHMFYKRNPPIPLAYCHHLYENVNWRLLSTLTPKDILRNDTNFYNLLKPLVDSE